MECDLALLSGSLEPVIASSSNRMSDLPGLFDAAFFRAAL